MKSANIKSANIRPTNFFKIGAPLLAFALLLTACSTTETSSPNETSSPTTTAPADDQTTETQPAETPTTEAPTETTPQTSASDALVSIVIGLEQEITNFNNLTAADNLLAGRQITRAIYPSCVRIRPDSTFEPYFCESLPSIVTESPLVVEYKLRADANWNDNTPVSSADLQYYFDNCNDDDDDCAATAGFNSASLEVIDEKTVQLSWPEGEPYVEYITLFGEPFPPSHLNRDWSEGFRENPGAAAGPYDLDEYNPGSDLTLVRNPSWFGDGPGIDEVTFRFISDVSSLPPALENGEVDVIFPQPQVDLVQQISGIDGVDFTVTFGPIWEHITFNTTTVPVEVRRAIAMAIDREVIISALMRPFSQDAQLLGNRVFVNGHSSYQDNTPPELQQRDVAQARATLEAAGYSAGSDGIYERDGNRLSLRIRTTGGNPRREQFQELVQNQLAEAGIEITIDNLPGGEVFGPVFGSENDPPGPPGDFDLVIFAWVGGPLPSGSTQQVFGTGSDSNPGAYVNAEVDDLIEQATVSLDLTNQAALLNEADTLMWDDLPNIPIYQLPVFLAYNDGIGNILDNPTTESFTWNIEEWTFEAPEG